MLEVPPRIASTTSWARSAFADHDGTHDRDDHEREQGSQVLGTHGAGTFQVADYQKCPLYARPQGVFAKTNSQWLIPISQNLVCLVVIKRDSQERIVR